jgi:hypothetical protein
MQSVAARKMISGVRGADERIKKQRRRGQQGAPKAGVHAWIARQLRVSCAGLRLPDRWRPAAAQCPAAILDRAQRAGPHQEYEACLLEHGKTLDVGVPDRRAAACSLTRTLQLSLTLISTAMRKEPAVRLDPKFRLLTSPPWLTSKLCRFPKQLPETELLSGPSRRNGRTCIVTLQLNTSSPVTNTPEDG